MRHVAGNRNIRSVGRSQWNHERDFTTSLVVFLITSPPPSSTSTRYVWLLKLFANAPTQNATRFANDINKIYCSQSLPVAASVAEASDDTVQRKLQINCAARSRAVFGGISVTFRFAVIPRRGASHKRQGWRRVDGRRMQMPRLLLLLLLLEPIRPRRPAANATATGDVHRCRKSMTGWTRTSDLDLGRCWVRAMDGEIERGAHFGANRLMRRRSAINLSA